MMEILHQNEITSGGRIYRHYEVRVKADSALNALILVVPNVKGTLERVYYVLEIGAWWYVRLYTTGDS